MVKQLTYNDLPLEETDLSIRTLGVLRNAGLLTLGDVLIKNIEGTLFPALSGKGQVLYETGLLLRFAEATLTVFQERTAAYENLSAEVLDSSLSSIFQETQGFAGSAAFAGTLAGNGIRTMRRFLSLSIGQIRSFPEPLYSCQTYIINQIRQSLGCPFFVPLISSPAATEHLQMMQALYEKSDRVPLSLIIGFDSSLRERLSERGFYNVGSVVLECLSHPQSVDTDLLDAQYILLNEYASRYESWYRDFAWAADRLRNPFGYPVLEKKVPKTPDFIWDPATDLWKRSKDNTMPEVLGPLSEGNIRYVGSESEKHALSERLIRQANARYWVQRRAEEAARRENKSEPSLYDSPNPAFQEPDNWRSLFEDLPPREEDPPQEGGNMYDKTVNQQDNTVPDQNSLKDTLPSYQTSGTDPFIEYEDEDEEPSSDNELSSFDGVVFPWEEEEPEEDMKTPANELRTDSKTDSSSDADSNAVSAVNLQQEDKFNRRKKRKTEDTKDLELEASRLAYEKQYIRHNGNAILSILPEPDREPSEISASVDNAGDIFIKDPVDGQMHPYDPENPEEVKKAMAGAKLFGSSAVSLYGAAPDGFHLLSNEQDADNPFGRGTDVSPAAAVEMIKAAKREQDSTADQDTQKPRKKRQKQTSTEISYRKWSKQKKVSEDAENHQMTLSELFSSQNES